MAEFSGYRRKVIVDPAPGRVAAAMEDDFHHFEVELEHRDGIITAVHAHPVRIPWNLCEAASRYLEQRLVGARLEEAAQADDPYQHCTHQFDIFLIAAAHVGDAERTVYDMTLEDADGPPRRALLLRNGEPVIDWMMDGSKVVSPEPYAGRELRKLNQWIGEIPRELHEPIRILRRGLMVGAGRSIRMDDLHSALQLPHLTGACFVFQPQRMPQAQPRLGVQQDFSANPQGLLADRATGPGK